MFWGNLEVIAFAGSKLRLTAVRRSLVERRATSATVSLARVPKGASGAERASPISPRITERLEFSASPPGPDSHKGGSVLDFIQPESCRLLASAPWCWTCKRAPDLSVTQGNARRAELVDAHGLVARLVLHQVRSSKRSAVVEAGPQNHSSHHRKPGALSVAVADIESPFELESAKCVTIAEAACSPPVPTPIETLFSELARRRLCSLAIREKP